MTNRVSESISYKWTWELRGSWMLARKATWTQIGEIMGQYSRRCLRCFPRRIGPETRKPALPLIGTGSYLMPWLMFVFHTVYGARLIGHAHFQRSYVYPAMDDFTLALPADSWQFYLTMTREIAMFSSPFRMNWKLRNGNYCVVWIYDLVFHGNVFDL